MPPSGPIENAQAHVTIRQAYDELSQEAMAVWLRLMVTTDEELEGGRHKVCGILNLSEGRSNAILRQLKHKGYIALIKGDRPYTPTKIAILRRPLLAGRHRFILLSNLLHDPQSGNVQAVLEDRMTLSSSLMSSAISGTLGVDIGDCLAAVAAMPIDSGSRVDTNCVRHFATRPVNSAVMKVGKFSHSSLPTKPEITHTKPGGDTKSETTGTGVIRRMKCVEIGKIPGLGLKTGGGSKKPSAIIGSSHKPSSSIEKMKRKDEEQRAKSKEERAKAKSKSAFVDWRLLDSKGTPDVSFTPSKKEHDRVMAIIEKGDSDPEAKRIRTKLGTKLAIQYERYRKQKTGGYSMTNGEFAHAVEAAVLCYDRYVTPVRLLRYWDAHIDNFHNGVMKIPTLSFLKSSHAVEGAAVARVDDMGRPTRSPTAEPIETHGFSDLSKLHKRLRPTLKEAGFKVEQYKDDVMLMIQKVAIPLKRGFKPGAPAEIEKMAAYIAEHHMEIDEDDNANFVFDDGDGDED